MQDFIIILVLFAVIGGAVAYIVKAKKSGTKCIGCPMAKTCATNKKAKTSPCNGNCSGCSGCKSENK